MSTTSSTRTNLTRYRDLVAKPRTAKGRARLTVERLAERYPGTAKELCALDHKDPFQLLAATILSAQCTDAWVNMVTPVLFASYPDPPALAAANPEDVEEIIHSTGFFRSKTKSLIGMATAVAERFGGEVPTALEDLVTHPRCGTEDGQRRAQRRVRAPRTSRRHARAPCQRTTRPDRGIDAVRAARRRQGRARAELPGPASRARDLQSPRDPARARDMYCPKSSLRRMPCWPISAPRSGNRRRRGLSTPF